jgi:hypothetical protein
LNHSLNAAFLRAGQLQLMASFRSAVAAGQLTARARAALSRQVRYAPGSEVAREQAAEGVENMHGRCKAIGSGGKIL